MKSRLSPLTRWTAIIIAVALSVVIILPLWRIELTAPQYPEGLVLKIHANKLSGDVEVVNGLNHYIGMRTLHEKDFPEFIYLPFIIGAFAFFGVITFLINKRWFYLVWVLLYLLFALLAMVDFYQWEYNYGHNLDPTAPIQVPDMTYQPPLIGFKQLLNFGVYSIPDSGGWIFIAVALIMCAGILIEWKQLKKMNKTSNTLTLFVLLSTLLTFAGCSTGPTPIKFGQDACDFCKMTISDKKFGGEVVTQKGKVYKFDDINCIRDYLATDIFKGELPEVYLVDYKSTGKLLPATQAYLLQSEEVHGPMGGNIAAFENEPIEFKGRSNYTPLKWTDFMNK